MHIKLRTNMVFRILVFVLAILYAVAVKISEDNTEYMQRLEKHFLEFPMVKEGSHVTNYHAKFDIYSWLC
jgi:cation transport regulator ChaC